MIIATAGHVDHGKTLLVKALTGVDTDRLPEEKKRNLTIDLGFAYRSIEGAETPIGFIDVPGHERFIRNALCGLAGTDFVLFIIAADDGPMPQSREHLAILDLLGIARGAVALTKTDRVPTARVAEVTTEIENLLGPTTLAGTKIFPVSAMTGDGIAELRDHLDNTARELPPRPSNGNFRLAIDRRFDVTGAGMIVTGTAFSGAIETGAQVKLLGARAAVRIRGIHAQNTMSATGRAGQRCALNLTGADLRKDAVKRGDWVVGPGVPGAVKKADAELRVLASEAKSFKHWTPVHVHLGAAETTGRVALLGAKEIAPGATALVQLVLNDPIGAVHSDHFIVRDQSAKRTIGGGRIIDIFPPARGRAKPERLAWLANMREGDIAVALAKLLDSNTHGVDVERFCANRNCTPDERDELIATVPCEIVDRAGLLHAFSPPVWAELVTALRKTLQAWHAERPDASGMNTQRAVRAAGYFFEPELANAIAAHMVAAGELQRSGDALHLKAHAVQLAGPDQKIWNNISPAMAQSAPRPVSARELAEATDQPLKVVEGVLQRAGRQGLVARISKTRYATPDVLQQLAGIAETLAESRGGALFSAAEYRNATGIGRNVCIEVLEFFDQQRFTFRSGDGRKVLKSADEVFGNDR